jgi:hypothetical protein
MAKKSTAAPTSAKAVKPKKKRPGVHAKSKRDVNKSGKHWVKAYRGQGR